MEVGEGVPRAGPRGRRQWEEGGRRQGRRHNVLISGGGEEVNNNDDDDNEDNDDLEAIEAAFAYFCKKNVLPMLVGSLLCCPPPWHTNPWNIGMIFMD